QIDRNAARAVEQRSECAESGRADTQHISCIRADDYRSRGIHDRQFADGNYVSGKTVRGRDNNQARLRVRAGDASSQTTGDCAAVEVGVFQLDGLNPRWIL